MTRRIVQVFLYAATSISLIFFLDSVFGAAPVTRHTLFLYATTLGVVLFVTAAVVSIFSLLFATRIALVAAVLSWPEFGLLLRAIPWNDLGWFLRYRTGSLIALLLLVVCTVYSLRKAEIIPKGATGA